MNNKKKILIFGATGMAGHMVYYYLKETNKYNISNVVFRTKLTFDSIVLDVHDTVSVMEVLNRIRPDVIVNCVGILKKGSIEHPDDAVYVNAYFPHLLKKNCDKIGTKLIHISTDCVFSGKKGNYTETDFRDADDVYGRSKALGEIINNKDLTLRTSIIGPELKQNGEGLFHWFMNQTQYVFGYKTAIWSGVTTLELAKAIEFVIDTGIAGLYNLTNGTGISKFTLLNILKQTCNKGYVNVIPSDGNGINRSLKKSVELLFNVPTYEDMLDDLYNWMLKRKDLYCHYFSMD